MDTSVYQGGAAVLPILLVAVIAGFALHRRRHAPRSRRILAVGAASLVALLAGLYLAVANGVS